MAKSRPGQPLPGVPFLNWLGLIATLRLRPGGYCGLPGSGLIARLVHLRIHALKELPWLDKDDIESALRGSLLRRLVNRGQVMATRCLDP